MNPRKARVCCAIAGAALALAPTAGAWTAEGHRRMTAAAIEAVADTLPPLSEESRALLVRASIQPDISRPRKLDLLRDLEASRHYIDLELLEGVELPEQLADYLRMVNDLSARPGSSIRRDWRLSTVGVLPYAITESAQRLATLFAQLRRREGDEQVIAMAMIQAGALAHYAQDLCQPLHTTVHHDGRMNPGAASPRSGIHRLVDGLPARLPATTPSGRRSLRKTVPMFAGILQALGESHSQVDRVYRLESAIRSWQSGGPPDPAVEGFVRERIRCAVELTADLIFTAWQLAPEVDLPGWASGDNPSD